LRAICLILLGNVVLVNNILRNRTDGSLTLTNQTLLQNFKDSIVSHPFRKEREKDGARVCN
jgi:hypothetical protein